MWTQWCWFSVAVALVVVTGVVLAIIAARHGNEDPGTASTKYEMFHWALSVAGLQLCALAFCPWGLLSSWPFEMRLVLGASIAASLGFLTQRTLLTKLGGTLTRLVEKDPKAQRFLSHPYTFAKAFGTMERVLYVLLFQAGQPGAVAFWLAFKVAAKWGQPENKADVWEKVKVHNLSLIGELVNIFYGLVGVVIVNGSLADLFKLQ